MTDNVRVLNEEGISRFREFISDLRGGNTGDPPLELLTNDKTSKPVVDGVDIPIELKEFSRKKDFVTYVHDVLEAVPWSVVVFNRGLWAWLALYYFDLLCPVDGNGNRAVRADAKYILAIESGRADWTQYYRHLIATPVLSLHVHGDQSEAMLDGKISTHGEYLEQVAARQQIFSSRTLVATANSLYSRSDGGRKRGVLTKAGAGGLRRYIAVLSQLDLTYDIYDMEPDKLLGLLPGEFNEWMN